MQRPVRKMPKNMSSMPNGRGGFSWLAESFGLLGVEKSSPIMAGDLVSPRLASDLRTKSLKASETNSLRLNMMSLSRSKASDPSF